jgi:ribonuclease Y
MEKFEFPEKEVHAAWTHHDSEPPKTPEAFLVKGADAISASRPGARQEALDKYIERMRQLEDISTSYEGVSKVQIMSAGREVRVMVDPQELDDELLQALADNIAKDVKENVAYPGYVRINAIRRTQVTETAK